MNNNKKYKFEKGFYSISCEILCVCKTLKKFTSILLNIHVYILKIHIHKERWNIFIKKIYYIRKKKYFKGYS